MKQRVNFDASWLLMNKDAVTKIIKRKLTHEMQGEGGLFFFFCFYRLEINVQQTIDNHRDHAQEIFCRNSRAFE
jgi:hypothetical protein